ncbi:MAG: DotD/TraH family lipoprotein [Desulfobacteraceae bacterium]|nr:DotD/TraH family lipoprotein [Desulfobacteraceae bacterium]
MKRLILKWMVMMMLLPLLCSCISFNKKAKPVVEPPPHERLSQLLNEHAQSIHQDLVKLTRIKQQKNKELLDSIKTPETPKDQSLNKMLTLKWAGPIEPAAKVLAQEIGYKFKKSGSTPVQQVLIHINAKGKPAYEVLQDMGWQAGENIGIVVHESVKTIELVYVEKMK